MATKATERTPLTGEAIEKGASLFAPADSDIFGKVTWVIDRMTDTQGPATGVAEDIEAYYALKGVKVPRGYGRASIVNAATDAKLWDRTTCGRTVVTIENPATGKSVKSGAAQLVGKLDAARHAHGGKTVAKLITETLESLATDVAPDVKYRAIMGALAALIEAPVPEKEKAPVVHTAGSVVGLFLKAIEAYDALGEDGAALIKAYTSDVITGPELIAELQDVVASLTK